MNNAPLEYLKSTTDRTYTMLPPHHHAPAGQFIYFVYSAGRIKIGFTRTADARHKQLTSTGPFPPVIVLLMHGTNGDEKALHVRFAEDRLHGEWFALSEGIREFLRRRLCDIGRASLEKAEADFYDYCESFAANYQPPPVHKPRKHCSHGMPIGAICPACGRERDLAILDRLNEEITP